MRGMSLFLVAMVLGAWASAQTAYNAPGGIPSNLNVQKLTINNVATVPNRYCGVQTGSQAITNSTTLTPASGLTATLPALGTYVLDGWIEFNGTTTGTQGLKFNFAGTSPGAGETGGYGVNGFVFGGSSTIAETSALSTVQSVNNMDTGLPNDWYSFRGVYINLRAGTVTFQIAQVTASGNPTNLLAGSYICWSRVN